MTRVPLVESDFDFLVHCGIEPQSPYAWFAIRLRQDLADYNRKSRDGILAASRVAELGFHPSDSLDIVEFTLMAERTTGFDFDPEEFERRIGIEYERLTVAGWVGTVIEIARSRGVVPPMICPECGYDLQGRLALGCPECGWGRAGE